MFAQFVQMCLSHPAIKEQEQVAYKMSKKNFKLRKSPERMPGNENTSQ